MRIEHYVSFYMSLIATFITFAYGPDAYLLTGLLFLMAADYITGILAAIIDGTGLCSKYGFRGLAKKAAVLVIVAVTHQLDVLLQSNVMMLGAIYFYCALELISITENGGRIGLPMPASVKNAIRILKEKVGDDDVEVDSQVSDHEVSSDRTE
jgi:toxin secretion/phage lysis holin